MGGKVTPDRLAKAYLRMSRTLCYRSVQRTGQAYTTVRHNKTGNARSL